MTIPSAHAVFKIAALFYLVAAPLPFLSPRLSGAVRLTLIPGILANLAAVWLRYYRAWPMLPMHLGPIALPLCLALLIGALMSVKKSSLSPTALRSVLLMLALFSLSAVLFPMDFYLPFIQSLSPFAHGFIALGALGKACFVLSSAFGVSALYELKKGGENGALENAFFWGALGYAFWTVSLFCGELWSYLGWGTPVVWEDAALLTTMATWFFYTCYLHLQLTKAWSAKGRAYYAAAGFLAVFVYTCVPELGPFRSPF